MDTVDPDRAPFAFPRMCCEKERGRVNVGGAYIFVQSHTHKEGQCHLGFAWLGEKTL